MGITRLLQFREFFFIEVSPYFVAVFISFWLILFEFWQFYFLISCFWALLCDSQGLELLLISPFWLRGGAKVFLQNYLRLTLDVGL